MTQPSNRAPNGPRDSGGGSGRRILLILTGMVMVCIGAVLMLQSVRSDPTKFNIGLVLAVVGGCLAAYLSLKQDRRKQQPKKRNGDTRHRNA